VRQILFLLASAMFVAFSLSWASPSEDENYYTLPDHVLLPSSSTFREKPEISASFNFDDTCESIEGIDQEIRGHKVIFSVRMQYASNQLCLQQNRSNINLNLLIDRFKVDSSHRVDIYFREDDENLKYFGSIEIKEKHRKLLTKY